MYVWWGRNPFRLTASSEWKTNKKRLPSSFAFLNGKPLRIHMATNALSTVLTCWQDFWFSNEPQLLNDPSKPRRVHTDMIVNFSFVDCQLFQFCCTVNTLSFIQGFANIGARVLFVFILLNQYSSCTICRCTGIYPDRFERAEMCWYLSWHYSVLLLLNWPILSLATHKILIFSQ